VSKNDSHIRCRIVEAVRHPYFILLLRIVLGGILVYAGWTKLFDTAGLAKAIDNYQILPYHAINIAAITLPAIELIAGLGLIFGLFLDGSLAITTALYALFVIAVESAILRGLNIECGCFGTFDAEIVGTKVFIRDVLFLLGCIPIWMSRLSCGGSCSRSEPMKCEETS